MCKVAHYQVLAVDTARPKSITGNNFGAHHDTINASKIGV